MQAIILAAGMGKRLKNLTQNNPKCMVKVNGVTLIERMLKQLEALGLEKIVIVVGFEGNRLVEYIDALELGTPIIYVYNNDYEKTNNIYSLALAKEYLLEDDTILLESDLIFEDGVLEAVVKSERDTVALVDKYESWMDGTVVKIDENDTIREFIPGNQFIYEDIPYYYKTVNIYKFSKIFSRVQYVPFLGAYMSALGNNEYYEQVLRVITLLDNPMIKAQKLNGQLWYEIDDVQDLDIASSIFVEDRKEKLERLKLRYGGYWRYPKLKNFAYPDNPFFPPKRLLDELKANADRLLSAYPSGMNVNALLVAKNLGGIDSDWVVVSNGLEEIIKSILSLHVGKVGMLNLTNEEYKNRKNAEDIVFYSLKNKNLSYSANDIIDFYDNKNIELLLLTNPDYHSGNYICKRDILKILNWSLDKNIRIVLDESYCEFADEKDNSLIHEDCLLRFPNLILLKNLSVTHGVSGLRLGCAVSSNIQIIKQMKEDVSIWNINSFAEFYLQIEEKYHKQYVESLNAFRKMREEFLADLEGIPYLRVVPTQANYVMCEVINTYSSAELTELLLNDYNILIKDLSDRVENQGQYIKLAMRLPDENKVLFEALKALSNKKNRRICGEAIVIDKNSTQNFFENRVNKKLPHRYNYVIYQDSNPQLALERDAYEKAKMCNYLKFDDDDFVLDIGCGVGRWGDELVKILNGGKYIGIDYSEKILQIAKENLLMTGKCEFYLGSFQNVNEVLKSNGIFKQFDKILINGVFMYINDDEIGQCFESIDVLLKNNGRVYIKESIGIEDRFTLKDFYSQELNDTYNAIYRSKKEYEKLLNKYLGNKGYKVVSAGETWDEENNRKETTSYYWIYEK